MAHLAIVSLRVVIGSSCAELRNLDHPNLAPITYYPTYLLASLLSESESGLDDVAGLPVVPPSRSSGQEGA